MLNSTPSPTLTILKRELLTGLRSWKSFLLLLALLGLLYSTAFYAMDTAFSNSIYMSGAMRSLFSMQVFAVGTIVFAVIPALAAVSINGERQEENYDMLLTTLITPRRIILGKFAAVLIRALLVAIGVLPFTGLVYFYAGVDVGSFFGALAVLVPAALCNTAIGLWCSIRLARPTQSIMVTFSLTTGIASVISMGMYYLPSVTIPGPAFLSLTKSTPIFLLICGTLQIAACGILLATMPVGDRLRPLSVEHKRNASSASRGAAPCSAQRPVTSDFLPIPDQHNPIRFTNPRGAKVRATKASRDVFFIMSITYFLVNFSISDRDIYMPGLERLCILILIPPIVATIMVKLRDEATFNMLRMTTLGSRDMLLGSFAELVGLLKVEVGAVLLCKFAMALLHLCHALPDSSTTPSYYYLLDLALLPLHFTFIVFASMLGASFSRRLIPAIMGASGMSIAASLVMLVFHRLIGFGLPPQALFSALIVTVSHTAMIGLFCAILAIADFTIYGRQWRATPQ